MSDPIRCQFRWTLDEFCTANEQHRSHARATWGVLIITWSRITNIVRTDKGFLMSSQPWMFYWLPVHCFTDNSDIERFEQLIANRESV